MKKQITVYLPPSLVRAIDKVAKQEKRTRTTQIEIALSACYLKQKEKA